MARAQYRGATKAQGFNPISVSQANISRMREESQRVVNNMTMRADAELNNRKRILQEMKENAQYYGEVRDRDYKIQSKNISTQQQASRDKAEQIRQQAIVDADATQQIFGTIAKISKTAGEKFQEIEQEKFDEDWLEGVKNYQMNPDPAGLVDYEVGQDVMRTQNAAFQGEIDVLEAQGADPLLVAKSRSESAAYAQGYAYAKDNSMLKNKLPQVFEAALNDSERKFAVGDDVFTGVEARGNRARTAAVLSTVQREFFIQNGYVGKKYESIAPGLAAAQRNYQSILSREGKVETGNIKSALKDTTLNTLANGNYAANIQTAFKTLSYTEGGYDGAHEAAGGLIRTLNPQTGEFLIPDEVWMNADVDGSGQPYSERFKARTMKLIQARQDAKQAWLSKQSQAENLSYRADAKRILEGLTADPSADNAKAAMEFFRKEYGKIPPEIEKFANSYTTEAIEDTEFLAQAEDLAARGMLTQEFLDNARSRGATISTKVESLYGQQKEKYGPEYDRSLKSLGQVAKDIVGVVPGKDTTATSAFLQTAAERDFQTRFQGYLALDMSPADAANKAALEVQNAMKVGKNDENSIYYRKVQPNGAVTFPQLEKQLTPTTAAKERLRSVQSELSALKSRALVKPGAILTEAESTKIAEDFKAGRPIEIPSTARYAATRLGINPLKVINAQQEANGQPSLSSPALEAAGEMSPSFQELLFKTPSAMTSTRAIGSLGTFNPALLPQRAQQYVPMFEQASKISGLPTGAIVATAEVEANLDPNAISYNGSSFGMMQLNKAAHAAFFQQNNWRDPQANLNYGANYLKSLVDAYGGDYKAAAMAYNAGPGNYDAWVRGEKINPAVEREMINHGRKFMQALYKYGQGGPALRAGQIQRPGSNIRQLAYITGDIGDGAAYTGQHLDVKRTDRSYFNYKDLDEFVEVDDPELGRVPLGSVPETGDFESHTRRGSHGRDYGTYAGTKLYVKNGAKVISSVDSGGNGDLVTIQLPNGKQYTLLHGKAPKK